MTKDEHIRVYMTPETKQRIKEKAKSEGLDPSVWMRHKAKKELPQEATA
jgi:uncharacterized protein YlaI